MTDLSEPALTKPLVDALCLAYTGSIHEGLNHVSGIKPNLAIEASTIDALWQLGYIEPAERRGYYEEDWGRPWALTDSGADYLQTFHPEVVKQSLRENPID
jgi:hypothetical protein